jgi:hypothetical protein
MKITLTMAAQHIPEGTTVRKPTGSKLYLMRRDGIKCYTSDYKGGGIDGDGVLRSGGVKVYGAGLLHLTCADHIQLVAMHDRLAIDFGSIEDAGAFLDKVEHADL